MTMQEALGKIGASPLADRIGAAIYGSPSAIGEEAGQRIAEGIMAGIKKRTGPKHRMMAIHPWFRGEWLRRYMGKGNRDGDE
jgi:hypothetical protein